MQIPILRPVLVRESSNKMYSSSAYYLAGWLSSTLFFLFYPVMCGSLTFFFLNFYDNSFENFVHWIMALCLMAIMGSTYGFMFGCLIED